MYDVNAQGVDERMINVHYYHYIDRSYIELAILCSRADSLRSCRM